MSLGSLFGIPLRIHWTCLILLGLWVKSGTKSTGLLCLFTLAGTILLHEFGHCFAARSVGGGAHGIMLWPLGGLAYVTGGTTPLKALWIAAAGPMMHIPLALLFVAPLLNHGMVLSWHDFIPLPGPLPTNPDEFLYWGFKLQIALFCFNVCLPAYPMDGGQILASILGTVLPLGATANVLGLLTILVAGGVFVVGGWTGADSPLGPGSWIALWLGYQGFDLIATAWAGNLDDHPLGRMHQGPNTIEMAPAVFVAPDTELIPCASCGKKMHPRTERCVECGFVPNSVPS